MASHIVAVCLHCAIPKDWYVFKGKKSPQGSLKSSKYDQKHD